MNGEPLTTDHDQMTTGKKSLWHHPSAAPLLIVLAGFAVYLNSFRGVFVFDDQFQIVDNPHIRTLWPPWACFWNTDNITRPVAAISLAISYAMSGLNTGSWHFMNLAIHVSCGLLLFGILRRTFETDELVDDFGGMARPLALAIALIWTVHPLNTQAVTYIIQREEALMGLFFLCGLYSLIRGWNALAAVSCALAVMTKQVAVVAPILYLIYDRTFISGTFRCALSRAPKMYAALAGTWVILVVLGMLAPEIPSAGFGKANLPSPLSYGVSQGAIICHYIVLALAPYSLCLDYAWPSSKLAFEDFLPVIPIVILLAAGFRGLRRGWASGFLAAWFFLILAPTSSIMPINDLAAEHRMYLPLMAVVTAIVVGFLGWIRKLPYSARVTLAAGIVLVLGVLTIRRNGDYESKIQIWTDVVEKRPENLRARKTVGNIYRASHQLRQAVEQYEFVLQRDPKDAEIHTRLGLTLRDLGDDRGAERAYRMAIAANPDFAEAHRNLGTLLEQHGKFEGAKKEYRETLRIRPKWEDIRRRLEALEKE